MNCYPCMLLNCERPAIGLCDQCSAGLCIDHAIDAGHIVTTVVPLGRIVELPLKARRLVCEICKQALEQPRKIA